jgi:hypothetical protein
MVKSWSGLVSLQCSTSNLIILVERRQSERSKDNTCDLGSTLEQLDPKVTTAGLSTLVKDLFLALVLWLFAFIIAGGFSASVSSCSSGMGRGHCFLGGGDILSIQRMRSNISMILFHFMFHASVFLSLTNHQIRE